MKDVITPFSTEGKEVPHLELIGTHQGTLSIGCFSANIRLEGGPVLAFNSPMNVPKELWPSRRGEDVRVQVKVYLNDLEQVVYDAEKI